MDNNNKETYQNAMNKGLDLIQRQQIETIDGYPTGNVYIGLTVDELAELEKELKDHDELSQLKSIKEELGVDLAMLFKALKNGIWFKHKDGEIVKVEVNYIGERHLAYIGYSSSAAELGFPDVEDYFPYEEYGKLWAFTREELLQLKEN